MLRRKFKEIQIGKWPLSVKFGNKWGDWQWGFNVRIWNFSFYIHAYMYGGRTFRIKIVPRHLYICGYIANGNGIAFCLECDRYEHRLRQAVKHLKKTNPKRLKEMREILGEFLVK